MIKDLDQLTAFLKICRKQGVTDIKFDGLSVSFGSLPIKNRKDEDAEDADIPTDELTPEQLMFFSAGATEQ